MNPEPAQGSTHASISNLIHEIVNIEIGPFSETHDLYIDDAYLITTILAKPPSHSHESQITTIEQILIDHALRLAKSWIQHNGDIIPDPDRLAVFTNGMTNNEIAEYLELLLNEANQTKQALRLALLSKIQPKA